LNVNYSFNFVAQTFKWLLHNTFSMLIIILFLITGISIGFFAEKISMLLKMNEKVMTLSIYLLLFMLAVATGLDDLVVKSLDDIGWYAFLLILGAAAASTIISGYLYKVIFKGRKLYNLS